MSGSRVCQRRFINNVAKVSWRIINNADQSRALTRAVDARAFSEITDGFITSAVKSYRGYKILQRHSGSAVTRHFRRRYLQVGGIMGEFLLTLKADCRAAEKGAREETITLLLPCDPLRRR